MFNYIQHTGKVIKKDPRFKHVMALSLNPKTNYQDGLIRCITSRLGDVTKEGSIDKSKLFLVKRSSSCSYKIENEVHFKYEKEIIKKINPKNWECLGPEDPDIWYDPKTNLLHVYFTMPFIYQKKQQVRIHLGHAFGSTLSSLIMTSPVLMDKDDYSNGGAKEISIAPVNKNGLRLNLIESRSIEGNHYYSTLRQAIIKDMNTSWEYGPILFHPKTSKYSWIAGHASPGPLLPQEFITIGNDKRVGFINGREKDKKVKGKSIHGIFAVGLFVYDFEKGIIEWISEKPCIKDSDAKSITFASCFVQTNKDKGILYAHVDDSFVRAYTITASEIKKLLL